MTMRTFQLSRRAVLKGSGSVAIALPWLEIMSPRRATAATTFRARRFLAVYQPGGTVLEKWTPTGTESAFTLSPILTPFQPVKDKILIPSELDMKSAVGEQRQAGLVAWLTGTAQGNTPSLGLWAKGSSIDQVIATSAVGAGKRWKSLSMAVRWGTGKAKGLASPIDIANYANTAGVEPVTPAIDPVKIWQDLFGGPPQPNAAAAKWNKSILDSVAQRYAKLTARLGAADKQRMEEHLTRIRELEASLSNVLRCAAPTLVDTTDYNPGAGLNSADDGSVKDLVTDAAIPKVGKLMTDMMVMAMACDLTAVGTLQWSDTEAKHTFPWLGLTETHAFYQNDGGYQPVALEKICTWYSTQHSYLLQQMAQVDMGGHSLLDESVVFFGSERQHAATYSKVSMPFILAGGGGGLRCGRWLRFNHQPHNNLLVSILNLFGDSRTTFGDALYCTGPLSGLT
jgi:hypothetical protein